MRNECCIVAAGPSPAFIRPGTFIIAADGGLDKLLAKNVSPDLIIGDFDSLGCIPDGHNILKFPSEKDDTDTMLCIKEALKRGYEKLYISGGLGGRLDHTVANIQSLIYAAKQGAVAFLCGENTTVTVIDGGKAEFSETCSGTISVFCFGDKAEKVNIKGLKYQTENYGLTNMFPIGVSNEFTGEKAEISAESGIIGIVWEGIPDDVLIKKGN